MKATPSTHAVRTLAILLLGVLSMAATAAPPKIVVFGGSGNIGQRIVAEALTRGAAVTVVVRDPNATTLAPDPRLTLVKGDVLDAAADANLIKGARAVVCAVSFRRPPDPSAYRKAAVALVTALRAAGGPQLIFVGGAGRFRLGGDQLVVDAQGQSRISMEDYAVAVLDEIEKPAHLRQRFTIGY
jgi:putative NADH-flavin reductase